MGLVAGGVGALGGGIASAQDAEAAKETAGLEKLGRGARKVSLHVNGADHAVSVEPRTTLLDALRQQAGFTGPKEVCDRGSCGGCTVLMDGKSVCSCMALAIDAEGAKIETVEGIAADPANAKLIDSFCEHDAAQCGFCIPGFVTRAKEMLAANGGKPMAFDEARAGLAGNICRCGTYSKIFDAVLAATGAEVARRAENNVALENERSRTDVREKVTGAAKYSFDYYPKNVLYAKFIRFPFGAGRTTNMAVEAAKAMPGVVEVEAPSGARAEYPGDRLGHVAGESLDAVEDAIEAMKLAFRVGEVNADPWEFYEGPPAPDHETQSQLDGIYRSAAAIAEATYSTQVQTHSCLEPHGCVVDHKGDRADVWASTQATFGFRGDLVRSCGLDAEKITVHCDYIGGGFGSKFAAYAEGSLAARLSKKHGRPCKVFLDRKEEHLDAGNRPGSIQYMKIAADKEGRLLGGRIHCAGVVGHAGGQGRVNNPFAYDFGEVERTETEIRTTFAPARAFRAPGHPQGVFAVESMIDELAAKLGVDPLKMRALNETSDRRRHQAKLGAEIIGWDRRKPDGASSGRVKRGFGMGAAHWHFWPTQCEAEVAIHRDGRVEAISGVQDIGTGTRTVLVDVAAHQLGIDRKWIVGKLGNSNYPEGPGSGGSVTARSVAPAIRDAAQRAKESLLATVASEWKVDADKIEIRDGVLRGPGGKSIAWADACGLLRSEKISERGSFGRPGKGNDMKYLGMGDTSATQFAEVEVDTETGVVRVAKIVAVQACGQMVNRLTVENQVCGGVIQGLSYALFEDVVLDKPTGGMTNPNLEWYKIAGSMDIPPIIPVLDVLPEDTGVRALGEPATIPTAGAIANAVANAIGARVRSLPITPERVLRALEEKGARA